MSDFNPFKFISDRVNSIEPSENDKEGFNHFMTQRCLAMKKGYEDIANNMNTENFFSLPKHIQCYAYTSFDGNYLKAKWKISKKSKQDEYSNIIKMIMKILKCSNSSAQCYLRYNNIDTEKIEDIYTRLYESDKIKFRAKKGKK